MIYFLRRLHDGIPDYVKYGLQNFAGEVALNFLFGDLKGVKKYFDKIEKIKRREVLLENADRVSFMGL